MLAIMAGEVVERTSEGKHSNKGSEEGRIKEDGGGGRGSAQGEWEVSRGKRDDNRHINDVAITSILWHRDCLVRTFTSLKLSTSPPSPSATASCLPLSKHIGRDPRGFPNAAPRMRERPRGSGEGGEGGRGRGSQERRGEGRGSGREGREASRRDVGGNLEEEGREVREQGEISRGMEDEDLARMQVRPLFLFLPPLSST